MRAIIGRKKKYGSSIDNLQIVISIGISSRLLRRENWGGCPSIWMSASGWGRYPQFRDLPWWGFMRGAFYLGVIRLIMSRPFLLPAAGNPLAPGKMGGGGAHGPWGALAMRKVRRGVFGRAKRAEPSTNPRSVRTGLQTNPTNPNRSYIFSSAGRTPPKHDFAMLCRKSTFLSFLFHKWEPDGSFGPLAQRRPRCVRNVPFCSPGAKSVFPFALSSPTPNLHEMFSPPLCRWSARGAAGKLRGDNKLSGLLYERALCPKKICQEYFSEYNTDTDAQIWNVCTKRVLSLTRCLPYV